MTNTKSPSLITCLAPALAGLVLYLFTLAPGVLEADAGEFQFVPWLPGIAHPTGYPLYVLLGWLWTHLLPFGTVAWRMNLLSAVLATAAVGFTAAAADELLAAALPGLPALLRRVWAGLTALLFGVTVTFWSLAVVAEVYALHALFVAALLWLALRTERRPVWPGWLALFSGLSLTHHRTAVLLLPVVWGFVWRRISLSPRLPLTPSSPPPVSPSLPSPAYRLRSTAYLILLFAAPLLLYLALPLIALRTPYAEIYLSQNQTLVLYENSPRGFLNHVMATVFTGDLRPGDAVASIPARLGLTWTFLRQQVGWLGALLALAGLLALRRTRPGLLLLTGLSFAAFTAFNLVYFIGDIYVLYIPAWLILTLWIGLSLPWLAGRLAERLAARKLSRTPLPVFAGIERRASRGLHHTLQVAGLVFMAGFVLVLLVTRLDGIRAGVAAAAPSRDWPAILSAPLPRGAVLLSNDRNEMMPMWYYQYVDHRRPDLIGLFPLITPDPAFANVGRVLDRALASGRPVYLIKPMDGLSLKADLSPEGPLWRAAAIQTGPAVPVNQTLPPSPTGDTVRLLGVTLQPDPPQAGQPLEVTLYWQAVQPLAADYTSFVHLVDPQGQGVAQSDHWPGGDYYPSRLWQAGETLRDRHTLTVPAGEVAGPYRLRVGMYFQTGDGQFVSMGEGLLLPIAP